MVYEMSDDEEISAFFELLGNDTQVCVTFRSSLPGPHRVMSRCSVLCLPKNTCTRSLGDLNVHMRVTSDS